ncbi:hypothetical protein [Sedimenticola selenatireducens]|uniref:hypothetical protein n=1 Tax=Sedimenticola selenatireducens TaxID=191960 RepID=UPI002AAB814B|nr:hypothetical protein [Sedimenticola selenatireducens]
MDTLNYDETRVLVAAQEATLAALVEVHANLMMENAYLKAKDVENRKKIKEMSTDLTAKDRHIVLLQSELQLSGRRIVS